MGIGIKTSAILILAVFLVALIVSVSVEAQKLDQSWKRKDPKPTPAYCLAVYDPVCGSDKKTYSNDCYASRAGVSVLYKGECKKPSPAPTKTPQMCPKVCTPLYELANDCKLNKCGSGCGADNIQTFKTERECKNWHFRLPLQKR